MASLRFGIEATLGSGGSPDWDSLQIEAGAAILEEAKSGAVEAEDRWTLWRRVRRTIAVLPRDKRLTKISVRLTVNAAALPANPEYWRTLASKSQTATGAWHTPAKRNDGTTEPRRAVRNADGLANEALHVLSSADADDRSPSMSLDAARAILSRFSLGEQHSADSIEDDVRRHLEILSRGIGVGQLLAGLRGEISRRAESKEESAHLFGAEELLGSLGMLERLVAIDPAALRRWEILSKRAVEGEIESIAHGEGLPYQDWRQLQPAAFATLEKGAPNAIALIGRGGMGKSVALGRWLTERREAGDVALLLTTNDLSAFDADKIAEALDLGAFAARHRGRRLVVGLDGLENAPDTSRRISLLSALRAVAIVDVIVCVTSRLLEWRSARGSAEAIAGWSTIEIDDWPDERVREQVNASGRPRLSEDLLRLLRTPLLLDLFIRTFGRDADVPPGLQTRHGLLQAYWDRRILPLDDERSAQRRSLLLEIATDEAAGIDGHTRLDDAARDLTSEGLLTMVRGGLRSFRHALLRDFTMMQWTRDRAASSTQVVAKLESVKPALVQFGTLRAVLESAVPWSASSSALSELRPPLLFHAATVLGEFDDLSLVSLESIVALVREEEQGHFLRALLAAIKIGRNAAWAGVLARLPHDSGWVSEANWFQSDLLLQLVYTLEAVDDEIARSPSPGAELGLRLRSWSLAPKILDEVSRGGGYVLGRLAKLLTKIDPSPATMTWVTRIAGVSAWTRYWVLSELPELVRALVASKSAVNDDVLRAAYCISAGLRDDAGRLRDDANVPRDAMTSYDRIEHALIGQGRSVGLISSKPAVFVGVAVDLVAGHEADEADERQERMREIRARLHADLDWSGEVTDEVNSLIAEAKRIAGKELAAADVGGTLIVDNPIEMYSEQHSDSAELLAHLQGLAAASIAEDGKFFDSFFWPSVARSRSALARACVLDLITRDAPSPREKVLDELVRDGRLYFLPCARRYLQRGIRMRWASLSAIDRQQVLANIRNCGREPGGNVYWPGPFLASIPETDRERDLSVFIQLYRTNGWELEIDEPSRSPSVVRRGTAVPLPERPRIPIAGLADAQQEPWRRLAEWDNGRIPQASPAEWNVLVDVVEALVARCLPAAGALLEHSEPLARLAEFAAAHSSGKDAELGESRLSLETLRALACWSIDALGSLPRSEVVENCEPFDEKAMGLPPKADLWMQLVDLADSLLWDESLRQDVALNASLFSAIDDVAQQLPARLAWNILARVRGWFRAEAQGKGVLLGLLADRVRDSRALSAGMRYLEFFTPAEQVKLIRTWLTCALVPPISPPRAFARDAGQHVGWAALARYGDGTPTGSREVISELVAAPSSAGLLSDPSMHRLFVGQSVFGAKQVLASGELSLDRVREFAVQMQECWRALLPSLDEAERKDAPAFALWVFHSVFDADEGTAADSKINSERRAAWWQILKPLAIAIVRNGPSREVNSLFRCMADSPLLVILDGNDVLDLLVALRERTSALSRDAMGHYWEDAISCASSVIESVFSQTVDSTARDQLYWLVADWAAPPLVVEASGSVAKRLRG